MKFTKMHGLGNDYIYFDCTRSNDITDPEKLSKELSHRNFGVGGDGIVLILRSEIADFRMRMFNADGSEGKMCGNATRCIGKYVFERGLTDKHTITLETLAGIKTLKLFTNGETVESVEVDMGKAVLQAEEIPVISQEKTVIGQMVDLGGFSEKITCVSMGNPHCILFCNNVDELDLKKVGPKFENSKIFPDRVNTEFVEIIDDTTLKMRVWERGSGETMACGTGACAVAVAAVLNGFCQRDTEITVKLLGGDLLIKYMTDETVYMRGPATFVFDGEII